VFDNVLNDLTDSRYRALNWQNDHTVEFRMFRGTLRFESIMACLEFAYAAWHFTRETPISKLGVADFMAWICRTGNRQDTRYLRAYLRAKKFREFYTAEQVVRPKDRRVAVLPSPSDQEYQMHRDPRARLDDWTDSVPRTAAA
jgi:hypothetical protein